MLKAGSAGSLKFRIGLFALMWIAVFTYKFKDLFLPYYWDELSGYMSGILYMADNGISLLPSAVPQEMSYGHPLLMHAVMATVMKVFGSSVAVMHFTTLVFTFVLSAATYFLAYELSKNIYVSALAFVILLFQPVVLAQSTQVLLETFLTMNIVLSLLFYLRKQYVAAMFFCTAALMTKETGLVLAITFVIHIVFEYILWEDKKAAIKRLGLFSLPFLVFGSFLLIQKLTYGWYLNPVNVGKSKLDIESMLQKIWDYPLEFTFVNQGRFAFSVLLLGALAIMLFRKSKKIQLPEINFWVIPIFFIGFILFSSIADALERYFLVLIPFAAILFAQSAYVFAKINKFLPAILTSICLIGNILNLKSDHRYTEVDMGYRHIVKTNTDIFDFVNSGEFKNDSVGFASPFLYAPVDQRFGYYKEKHFISDTGFSANCPYKIFNSPGNADKYPPDTLKYLKIKEFTSGYSKSALYKRKDLF